MAQMSFHSFFSLSSLGVLSSDAEVAESIMWDDFPPTARLHRLAFSICQNSGLLPETALIRPTANADIVLGSADCHC
jgi:hypothetical protein